MSTENIRTTTNDTNSNLTISVPKEESVDKSWIPLKIPEPVRKSKVQAPKKSSKGGKPPKRGRKKKHVKSEPKMTKGEMLKYFSNLQTDPNFGILPFPRFVIEQDPMKYAGEDPKQFEEKMKRIDFMYALENAKTEEERRALIDKRKEELKNQYVPAYSAVSSGAGGNPYKG